MNFRVKSFERAFLWQAARCDEINSVIPNAADRSFGERSAESRDLLFGQRE
jgi:hypothetical protein